MNRKEFLQSIIDEQSAALSEFRRASHARKSIEKNTRDTEKQLEKIEEAQDKAIERIIQVSLKVTEMLHEEG